MLYYIFQHVYHGYDSVQLRIHDNEQPSDVEQNSRVGPRNVQHAGVRSQHCLEPVRPPQVRFHWHLHL